MAFERQQAEENLRSVLQRVRQVNRTLEDDIVIYRQKDTLVDEDDEFKTFRDIRFYALKAYRGLDDLLRFLDRYQ